MIISFIFLKINTFLEYVDIVRFFKHLALNVLDPLASTVQ